MKKRIAVFIVFVMLMSVMFAGCGGNDSDITENTNPNVDNQTSSFVSDQTTENTQNEEKGSFTGLYDWTVGKYTLQTRINIMDYIDGDIWHANEMADALGWCPITSSLDGTQHQNMNAKKPTLFQCNEDNDLYIRIGSVVKQSMLYYLDMAGTGVDIPKGQGVLFGNDWPSYTFLMNGSDARWCFEGIVCFAYMMENFPTNHTPFEGVLYLSGIGYTFNE